MYHIIARENKESHGIKAIDGQKKKKMVTEKRR